MPPHHRRRCKRHQGADAPRSPAVALERGSCAPFLSTDGAPRADSPRAGRRNLDHFRRRRPGRPRGGTPAPQGLPHAPGPGRRPAQHGTAGRAGRVGRAGARRPARRRLPERRPVRRPACRRESAPRRPGRRGGLRDRLADGRRVRLRRPRPAARSAGRRPGRAGEDRRLGMAGSAMQGDRPGPRLGRRGPGGRGAGRRNCCWPARRKSVCPARACAPSTRVEAAARSPRTATPFGAGRRDRGDRRRPRRHRRGGRRPGAGVPADAGAARPQPGARARSRTGWRR